MTIPRNVFSSLFVLSLAAVFLGLVLHGLTYFGIDPRNRSPLKPLDACLPPLTAVELYDYLRR
jgi:hypothetical protein